MSEQPPPLTAREKVGEIAPKFLELGDQVLYADIWERPQLSKRDRSLVTCAAVVAGGWTEQMKTHFPKAIQNGVTKEELIELITHMAFYSGWPSASTAILAAREILADPQPGRLP
jgi:4-carboxymuconolactone decarboxylase